MTVLVAEPLAEAAVALLKSQPGWNVIVSSPKEYSNHLAEADALIVRSAVQVNQSVLDKAPRLRVIGRAGVGVDNVDLEAATAAGVLVMNTTGGNAISVAEHTLALMLAMARRIPEATQSTTGGKWEKKKFMGSELRGKSLGIIGLGSIGREVVKRARAFEMRVQAYDPYVTAQIAKDLGVELVDLAALYAHSDYITLHVALPPEPDHMLSHDAFARMKPGVRIVNCARGELVDDEALRQAIDSGKVASAALDVFSVEPPPPGYPLFAGNKVLATPHIGGSTEEAQEIVGVRIAEQVVEYLKSAVALNAVNMPALSPEQYRTLGPYINVAERANLINAMQIAGQRGWNLAERHEARSGHTDSIRLELETDCGVTVVEGAVLLGNPRLIQVDGIYCEAPLSGHLIFMKNQDVPGVIGHVGMVLGRNNINIANFSLGRGEVPAVPGEPLEAVAVVSTDDVVPESVLQQLRENPAVKLARSVEFG